LCCVLFCLSSSFLLYIVVSNTYCVVFCFVCLHLVVYPMLPVSLDCPFLIAPLVFSNVYLNYGRFSLPPMQFNYIGISFHGAQTDAQWNDQWHSFAGRPIKKQERLQSNSWSYLCSLAISRFDICFYYTTHTFFYINLIAIKKLFP
jgi:hypothetical protein